MNVRWRKRWGTEDERTNDGEMIRAESVSFDLAALESGDESIRDDETIKAVGRRSEDSVEDETKKTRKRRMRTAILDLSAPLREESRRRQVSTCSGRRRGEKRRSSLFPSHPSGRVNRFQS